LNRASQPYEIRLRRTKGTLEWNTGKFYLVLGLLAFQGTRKP
jgi:hypothetical protein